MTLGSTGSRASTRSLLVATIAGLIGLAFVAATLVVNLAKVAHSWQDNPHVVSLATSYLRQDWRLFAPTPPEGNYAIGLQFKVRGHARPSGLYDVEASTLGLLHTNRLLPSKQAGLILALHDDLVQMRSFQKRGSYVLTRDTERHFSGYTQLLQRFLSYNAHRIAPDEQITSVRATYYYLGLPDVHHQSRAVAPAVVARSTWLGYVSDVGH
jgi:Family of unknown function (DUF5819)